MLELPKETMKKKKNRVKRGKVGRPLEENPKTVIFSVRLSAESVSLLDECCENLNVTRGQALRYGIEALKDAIVKRDEEEEERYWKAMGEAFGTDIDFV